MDYMRRQEAFKSRCRSGPFIHLTNFLSTYYVSGTKDTARETWRLPSGRKQVAKRGNDGEGWNRHAGQGIPEHRGGAQRGGGAQ